MVVLYSSIQKGRRGIEPTKGEGERKEGRRGWQWAHVCLRINKSNVAANYSKVADGCIVQ